MYRERSHLGFTMETIQHVVTTLIEGLVEKTGSALITVSHRKKLSKEFPLQLSLLWKYPSERLFQEGRCLVSELLLRSPKHEGRAFARVETPQEEVRTLLHFSGPFTQELPDTAFDQKCSRSLQGLLSTLQEIQDIQGSKVMSKELLLCLPYCFHCDRHTRVMFRNSGSLYQVMFYSCRNKKSGREQNVLGLCHPLYSTNFYIPLGSESSIFDVGSTTAHKTMDDELLEALIWLKTL
jgi:hypothetical protein